MQRKGVVVNGHPFGYGLSDNDDNELIYPGVMKPHKGTSADINRSMFFLNTNSLCTVHSTKRSNTAV